MSTHANIIIRQGTQPAICFYRHYDGFLHTCGKNVAENWAKANHYGPALRELLRSERIAATRYRPDERLYEEKQKPADDGFFRYEFFVAEDGQIERLEVQERDIHKEPAYQWGLIFKGTLAEFIEAVNTDIDKLNRRIDKLNQERAPEHQFEHEGRVPSHVVKPAKTGITAEMSLALILTVSSYAQSLWEDFYGDVSDFGVQHISDTAIVFGGTNRLVWTVNNGFRLDEALCTERFKVAFKEWAKDYWVTTPIADAA